MKASRNYNYNKTEQNQRKEDKIDARTSPLSSDIQAQDATYGQDKQNITPRTHKENKRVARR